MAVIRDVMPAFDLLQPDSAAEAQKLLRAEWRRCVGDGRRPGQLRLAEGPHQEAEGAGGSERRRGAEGNSRHKRWRRDRRHDHADGDCESPRDPEEITACWRRPCRWWPRRRFATRARWAATYRRTCAAGTTAADGRATARAEIFAMPIRRWDATASMRSSARTAAWPCTRRIRCRR